MKPKGDGAERGFRLEACHMSPVMSTSTKEEAWLPTDVASLISPDLHKEVAKLK